MNVIDNFSIKTDFNNLNKFCNSELNWETKTSTTDRKSDNVLNYRYCVYDRGEPLDKNCWNIFNPILKLLSARAILRIAINKVPRIEKSFITDWHTDFPYKDSKTSIIYMNTNNGYTILKTKNEDKKVNSIENRCLTFSSNTLHAVQLHTDIDERIVINLNYF